MCRELWGAKVLVRFLFGSCLFVPFVLKGKIPQKSRRLEKKRKNIKPTTSFLFFLTLAPS